MVAATTTPTSIPAKPKIVLEPINLHNADEFDEVLRQRILCGWFNTTHVIEAWRDEIDRKRRALFWIHLPPPTEVASGSDNLGALSPGPQRIGHIGLRSVPGDDAALADLANLEKPVLMVSAFFILERYRRGGLGRAAMEALEATAQVEPFGSPDCQAMILTAISRKYLEDDGGRSPDDWHYTRALWPRLGEPAPPKGSSAEDWYARMGYIKWKEEPWSPATLLDGTEFKLLEAFMRKQFY